MVRYAAARASGRSFICGDAASLPFKAGVFGTVSISFGLHEKSFRVRRTMINEVKRVLAEDGLFLVVDFENPRNSTSSIGALFTRAIERSAGGDHYRNGREFLRLGGLRTFLRENGFAEVSRGDIDFGSIGVVASRLV